mmetsp:Transcript_31042/g.56460  ORF Transcript_31042/g.56460 Transcript_31042/m.56460 type:complete len:91 (+) Transcript_31042:423-695(+)
MEASEDADDDDDEGLIESTIVSARWLTTQPHPHKTTKGWTPLASRPVAGQQKIGHSPEFKSEAVSVLSQDMRVGRESLSPRKCPNSGSRT